MDEKYLPLIAFGLVFAFLVLVFLGRATDILGQMTWKDGLHILFRKGF